MERYFIIFYHARNTIYTSRGNVSATTARGEYISRKKICGLIAAKLDEFDEKDIILTNVIELTEKEYREWED